jgi:hypothetical protein
MRSRVAFCLRLLSQKSNDIGSVSSLATKAPSTVSLTVGREPKWHGAIVSSREFLKASWLDFPDTFLDGIPF